MQTGANVGGVGLSDDGGPYLLSPLDDNRVRIGDVVLENGRPERGVHALGRDQILDRGGQFGERADSITPWRSLSRQFLCPSNSSSGLGVMLAFTDGLTLSICARCAPSPRWRIVGAGQSSAGSRPR